MQRPVGSTVTDGRAELTDVWELFSNRFGIWAYIHVLLVGLTTAAVVIFGVACWHLVRGRNQDLFRHAAKLALIVGVPISAVNLGVGSQMGVVVTDYQPMKIASTEAQWDTCQPCAFSLFQIGGFTEDDQTPSFSIQVPHLLSILATLSWDGEVQGMNELQAVREPSTAPGDYIPPVRTTYWSMRIMAYAGTLVFLVFALGAFLYWRGRLASTRWFLWLGVLTIPLPYARGARRLGALGGRAPAVDRVGPAEDGRCQLAQRLDGHDRHESRHVRRPLRRASDRGLRPHAQVRACRPARGRR